MFLVKCPSNYRKYLKPSRKLSLKVHKCVPNSHPILPYVKKIK